MEVPGPACRRENTHRRRPVLSLFKSVPFPCHCLPACIDDRIEVTTSPGRISRRLGYTVLQLEFTYTADVRITTLAFSVIDFLVGVGGFIGLLLGSSLLSLGLSSLGAGRALLGWRRQARDTAAQETSQVSEATQGVEEVPTAVKVVTVGAGHY